MHYKKEKKEKKNYIYWLKAGKKAYKLFDSRLYVFFLVSKAAVCKILNENFKTDKKKKVSVMNFCWKVEVLVLSFFFLNWILSEKFFNVGNLKVVKLGLEKFSKKAERQVLKFITQAYLSLNPTMTHHNYEIGNKTKLRRVKSRNLS